MIRNRGVLRNKLVGDWLTGLKNIEGEGSIFRGSKKEGWVIILGVIKEGVICNGQKFSVKDIDIMIFYQRFSVKNIDIIILDKRFSAKKVYIMILGQRFSAKNIDIIIFYQRFSVKKNSWQIIFIEFLDTYFSVKKNSWQILFGKESLHSHFGPIVFGREHFYW